MGSRLESVLRCAFKSPGHIKFVIFIPSQHCQEIEDVRIEFMKDNIWAYANAVSTVCVSDDEVSRPRCLCHHGKLTPFSGSVLREGSSDPGDTRTRERHGELCARLWDWPQHL